MEEDLIIPTVETVEEIKEAEFNVLKKEENSAILNVLDWRMRVYYDAVLTNEEKEKIAVGKKLKVEYTGDLKDVFSVRLQPLIIVD